MENKKKRKYSTIWSLALKRSSKYPNHYAGTIQCQPTSMKPKIMTSKSSRIHLNSTKNLSSRNLLQTEDEEIEKETQD